MSSEIQTDLESLILGDFKIRQHNPPHDESLLHSIGRLRVEAWLEETCVSEHIAKDGEWLDGHEAAAVHWLVHRPEDSALVGVARLTLHETLNDVIHGDKFAGIADRINGRIAGMTRLALLKSIHHRGVWRDLDMLRIAQARKSGACCILAYCGNYRLDKLSEEGFEQVGDTFPDADVPGQVCYPICLWL